MEFLAACALEAVAHQVVAPEHIHNIDQFICQKNMRNFHINKIERETDTKDTYEFEYSAYFPFDDP